MSADRKTVRLDHGQIESVDDSIAEVLHHKTPAQRIQIGFDIWESVVKMLTAHLKRTHPNWNLEMVREEVAKRLSHGSP